MENINATTAVTATTTSAAAPADCQIFTTPTLPGVALRVVTGEDGEPWFVARDVAQALGYDKPGNAIQQHCKKFNKITQVPVSGFSVKTPPVQLLIIPESDLYRLVMRSNLPDAVRFQDWVVEEVLPAIRKHGGYLTPAKLEEALTDPDTIIRLATALKKERDMRKIAETARDAAETMLEDAAPKARTYDAVMAPRKLELLTFCRRFRDVNLNRVKDSLEKAGVMYRRAGIYKIYATYRDSHFSERTDVKTGRLIIIVEPKGQQLLARLWNEGKLARKKNKTTLN